MESDTVGTKTLVKAAVIGARAAWSLNQWDRMDQFLTQIPGMCSSVCMVYVVVYVWCMYGMQSLCVVVQCM